MKTRLAICLLALCCVARAGAQQTGYSLGPTPAPKFSAYQNASSQSITQSVATKVTFDAEVFDTNSNFASSRFTPTIAGKYIFTSKVTLLGNTAGIEVRVMLYKNGSEYVRLANDLPATSSANPAVGGSAIADANGTTDYFEVYINHGNSAARSVWNTSNGTYFMGAIVP